MRKYSVVVPVYNRPDEIAELLGSLTRQSYAHFEVIVVEDGSAVPSWESIKRYADLLDLHYFTIDNVGQGFARNYGFTKASGDYFVIFDSDTIIPNHYFEAVERQLNSNFLDAYGGPDRASENFSPMQKAISYAMTSFFTTGGIRGQAKNAGGAFQPRSFNMGMSREVFQQSGGYARPYFGEDVEFARRLQSEGYTLGLIPDAYVFHKRRGNFRDFWKQVHYFGRARIDLDAAYPGQGFVKPVHAFPALFTIFCALIPVWLFVSPALLLMSFVGIGIFIFANFVDATLQNKSIKIGLLSVGAAFVQLLGYGTGFLQESARRIFNKK